jgi:polyisoprenoid-binding protein YceI
MSHWELTDVFRRRTAGDGTSSQRRLVHMADQTSTQPQASSQSAPQGVWQADPMHTQVEFAAKHLGMMTVRGHFAEVSVTGQVEPFHPEATQINVTIQTASIRTHNDQRDNDLRSSNFLEVDKYPTITFKSTKIEPAGGDKYTMTGDLTIKGTTRPVKLDLVRYGEFNDPMMGHRIGYSAEGKINRKDFGMTFSMMLDGKWIVSEEIQLMIEGEIVEQKPEQTAGA